LLYLIGHLLDILTTFLLSPDLSRENNILIARFGLGWGFVLLSAAGTSAVMLMAQLWMWNRLFQRFPATRLGYSEFYHVIFYGTDPSPGARRKPFLKGALIGLAVITASAIVAAKLLTGLWHLVILAVEPRIDSFLLVMFLKNLAAGCVGLVAFFVYPYLLHRKPSGRCAALSARG
jgi:hypothetical protein